jgi:hypothetical protein
MINNKSASTTFATTLNEHRQDINNWKLASKLPELYPQLELTPSKVKHLLWQRHNHPGLASCCSKIGNRLYICVPLFGLWLGGQLPEQLATKGVAA